MSAVPIIDLSEHHDKSERELLLAMWSDVKQDIRALPQNCPIGASNQRGIKMLTGGAGVLAVAIISVAVACLGSGDRRQSFGDCTRPPSIQDLPAIEVTNRLACIQ